MKRFAEEIVPFGFRIAWRRAIWPTSRSPFSRKATTDGVVRLPSALGMTCGWPPSIAAITEFVVPRSMPTALPMTTPIAGSTCHRHASRARTSPASRIRVHLTGRIVGLVLVHGDVLLHGQHGQLDPRVDVELEVDVLEMGV